MVGRHYPPSEGCYNGKVGRSFLSCLLFIITVCRVCLIACKLTSVLVKKVPKIKHYLGLNTTIKQGRLFSIRPDHKMVLQASVLLFSRLHQYLQPNKTYRDFDVNLLAALPIPFLIRDQFQLTNSLSILTHVPRYSWGALILPGLVNIHM